MIMGKLLDLSVPQFLYLESEDKVTPISQGYCGGV